MKLNHLAWELLIVVLLVGGLLFWAGFYPDEQWSKILIPFSFLYIPTFMLLFRKKDLADYGLQIEKLKMPDVKVFLIACLVILIPYALLFVAFKVFVFGDSISWKPFPRPASLGKIFLIQILVISFPEEFFFRGYLQNRLRDFFQKSEKKDFPKTFLGAHLPIKSILLSNFLFAASHLLISFHPLRLLTFFPGLVLAWLWCRTRNLGYPVLFHALCNCLNYALLRVLIS